MVIEYVPSNPQQVTATPLFTLKYRGIPKTCILPKEINRNAYY